MDAHAEHGELGLMFEAGFKWDRGFVKRATLGGRAIRFHITAQLATNCLPATLEAQDPITAFGANDEAVQAACRRAWQRAGRQHQSSIQVLHRDFSE